MVCYRAEDETEEFEIEQVWTVGYQVESIPSNWQLLQRGEVRKARSVGGSHGL